MCYQIIVWTPAVGAGGGRVLWCYGVIFNMSYYIVSIIARSSSSDTCNNYKKNISTQCAACDKFCVFFQNEHSDRETIITYHIYMYK